MKKSNQIESEIYLAKIVSFDSFTLLVDKNELDMPFEFEDYKFVVKFGDSAYDLIDGKKYHIINMVDNYIPDEELEKLRPHIKYVYDMYPFFYVWNRLEQILSGDVDFIKYMNSRSQILEEQHEEDTPKCKIIDFRNIKIDSNGKKD